jgi:hypothetical protein
MSTLEIIARYQGERMRWPIDDPESPGDFTLIGLAAVCEQSREICKSAGIDTDEPVTIKGIANDEELERNGSYRFFGSFSYYTNRRTGDREKQFHFRSFTRHVPHDPDGLADYLTAAGKGNGIGHRKAMALVRAFGCESVLSKCKDDIAAVMAETGIKEEQAKAFAELLRARQATENSTLEVERILAKKKFPRALTRKLIKTWGAEAPQRIHDDPFSLMQFRGVGFLLADRLWIDLGKDPAAIRRQAAYIWHEVHTSRDGHAWHDVETIAVKLRRAIGAKASPRDAILAGKEIFAKSPNEFGAIATARSDSSGRYDPKGGKVWVADGKDEESERWVADLVSAAVTEVRPVYYYRQDDPQPTAAKILDSARCQRCYRPLTAPEIHVLHGRPYGPTCITHVDPRDTAEIVSQEEWNERNEINPQEASPAKLVSVPEVSLWPDESEIEGISDHQREQIGKSLTARVGLLGGSPGTGKTYTIAALIKAIAKSGRVPLDQIAIGAPTGKAAVRLTESLHACGLSVYARTWHSLLGVAKAGDGESEEWGFVHGLKQPWSYRVIIGDETSMVPAGLMASILKARPNGCHALFVGDANQLAPVGVGAPFRDFIGAGLAYGELREIKRNSGGIVEACADIRDQRPWAANYCDPGQNLWITGDRTPASQIARILSLIENCPGDPVWDCQVLTAVNQRSELSREVLNHILQDRLNPNPPVEGTDFRIGDKVVCLSNGGYDPTDDTESDGQIYVANGEIGRVREIMPGRMIVTLESGERDKSIVILRGPKSTEGDATNGCPWDLAYAMSVHKYQGSEQKTVIGVLDNYFGAKMLCDRAWIYTLISRAKHFCQLIGTKETAELFCKVSRMHLRKTFLADRIRERLYSHDAEGL